MSMTDREEVLQTAIDLTMGDRNEVYGDPTGQMQLTWDMWELYQKHTFQKYAGAHDAAMFLAINKLSRIAYGSVCKKDHYIDLAAYVAIAFEAELVNQKKPSISQKEHLEEEKDND